MKKRILAIGIVLALVTALAVPIAVLADNSSSQGASTSYAGTILIRNVADGADVSTITFPGAAGGSTVTNPTGNGDVQNLTATGTEAAPVAILKSDTTYNLWCNVNDTGNWAETVATEYIHTISIGGSLTLSEFTSTAYAMTTWTTDQDISQTLTASVNMELYLGVLLQSAAGESGTSTITVLGETP